MNAYEWAALAFIAGTVVGLALSRGRIDTLRMQRDAYRRALEAHLEAEVPAMTVAVRVTPLPAKPRSEGARLLDDIAEGYALAQRAEMGAHETGAER